MKEQVFNAYETGLFYRDVVKRTYITAVANVSIDIEGILNDASQSNGG